MMKRLALIAALGLAMATHASAQDIIPFKIGAASATNDAPIFVAVEKGMFAKHGLDAKVIMYQTGVDMVNGLLNGAQDVNIMGSVPFLTGVGKGFPLVLIAHLEGDPTSESYSNNESIVAGPNAGIGKGEVAKLKGKRIGLPRGTGAEGYLLGVLKAAGLSQNDVTLVNLQPAELVTALNQGDVDAIAAWQPWGSTALVKVKGAVGVKEAGCPSCYDPATVLTTKQTVTDKSEALTRFVAAFAEAEQWVRKNPDATAAINLRWIQGVGLPIEKLALAASNFDPRISKLTNEMYQQKSLPLLASLGHASGKVDTADAIDASFLAKAEQAYPAYFDDLPKIPADLVVK